MAKDMGEYWLWITRYPDGTLGTVGVLMPALGMMAQIGGRTREVAEGFRENARSHALRTGQPVWLRVYRSFEDMGEA